MDVLIVAANARSLIANRGHLINEMLAQGLTVAAAVPTRDFLPEVEGLGITIYPIRMGRTAANPWQDLSTTWSLVGLMRRLKPRLVFGYSAKPIVYGAIAARISRVPRVYSMVTGLGHAYTTYDSRTRVLRIIMGLLYSVGFRCSDRVFFQNPDDERDFIDLGIFQTPHKAVRVNGSGVDIESFAERPVGRGFSTFLFIGRLLTEKGIREFVEAAELLHAEYPHARFVAVGPHDPTLPHAISASLLAEWQRRDVVQFVGGVDDVRQWLEACSVFVLPSYREGTPRSVLEAMSTGRAVITSDAPGCRETVTHGLNGYLVPPRSVQPLADAMRHFIEDPESIQRMGQASRQLVVDKYDVRKVNRIILEAMELA